MLAWWRSLFFLRDGNTLTRWVISFLHFEFLSTIAYKTSLENFFWKVNFFGDNLIPSFLNASFFMAVLLFTIDAIVSASVFVPLGNLLFDWNCLPFCCCCAVYCFSLIFPFDLTLSFSLLIYIDLVHSNIIRCVKIPPLWSSDIFQSDLIKNYTIKQLVIVQTNRKTCGNADI